MMLRVAGVSGQQSATKSARGSTASSRSGGSTSSAVPSCLAGSRFSPIDPHAARLRDPGQLGADGAEPEDDEGVAGEIVLALGERGDHAPPDVSALIVPRLGQMARQGEDERHAMLGDGIPVDAARIRERDAPRAEVVERELIVARADRLDVGQPLRPRQDLVAPEARDDQDIRRADARQRVVQGGSLEMGHAGSARLEPLRETVGGVRELDRDLVAGGEALPCQRLSPLDVGLLAAD